MEQNEKNRIPGSGEDDILNEDQTSQRRKTDNQNQNQRNPSAGIGQRSKPNISNSKDRGISGMMADMDDDRSDAVNDNRNDSLNRDRNNSR